MAHSYARDCRSTVVPSMRYRDAHRAIDWLVRALGFERKAVYDGPDGTVMHAELTYGNGMIMLGSLVDDGETRTTASPPDEMGLREATGCSLLVTDATAIYAMAKAAGAEIAQELAEMPYGGKAFSCLDLEGHRWWVGEYDPWAAA